MSGYEDKDNIIIPVTIFILIMETRNVTLTFEKAKEFYNSGNDVLKEVALQAFTKEELTNPEYTNIKTFEGACRAIGIVYRTDCDLNYLSRVEGNLGKHLTAIYKMDIIRKALNGNWNPSLVEGKVFYPFVEFYLANKVKEATNSNGCKLGPSFMADGEKYTLIGGGYYCVGAPGVGNFLDGDGYVNANAGLLGCKSEEIARHMSRYFMKEIFEAVYAQHIGMYEWV